MIHEGAHMLIAFLFGSPFAVKLVLRPEISPFSFAISGKVELEYFWQYLVCYSAGFLVNIYAVNRCKKHWVYYFISFMFARTDFKAILYVLERI